MGLELRFIPHLSSGQLTAAHVLDYSIPNRVPHVIKTSALSLNQGPSISEIAAQAGAPLTIYRLGVPAKENPLLQLSLQASKGTVRAEEGDVKSYKNNLNERLHTARLNAPVRLNKSNTNGELQNTLDVKYATARQLIETLGLSTDIKSIDKSARALQAAVYGGSSYANHVNLPIPKPENIKFIYLDKNGFGRDDGLTKKAWANTDKQVVADILDERIAHLVSANGGGKDLVRTGVSSFYELQLLNARTGKHSELIERFEKKAQSIARNLRDELIAAGENLDWARPALLTHLETITSSRQAAINRNKFVGQFERTPKEQRMDFLHQALGKEYGLFSTVSATENGLLADGNIKHWVVENAGIDKEQVLHNLGIKPRQRSMD